MPESRDYAASARVLERVARFLRGLDPHDLEAVADGRARLTIEYPREPRSERKPRLDVEAIVSMLLAVRSRDEAMDLLIGSGHTRPDLVAVARALEAPSQKGDTVQRLRERIVEAAVGYRLRSQAIRGVDDGAGARPNSEGPSH